MVFQLTSSTVVLVVGPKQRTTKNKNNLNNTARSKKSKSFFSSEIAA